MDCKIYINPRKQVLFYFINERNLFVGTIGYIKCDLDIRLSGYSSIGNVVCHKHLRTTKGLLIALRAVPCGNQ